MLLDLTFLLLGGLGLYYGAEWLVYGASRLARALGVSQLVIGLTIVSYGTSAPELAVSLIAALEGKSAIALGNVIGSNVANIGLILGITALIAPPKVDRSLMRRELPVLLIATAALPVVMIDGVISRLEATIFFAGSILFTYSTFKWADGDRLREQSGDEKPHSPLLMGGLVIVGLGLLIGGGQGFVNGAVGIARGFGMSERLVGLTIVAVGTSLPELAASLVAAIRGHSELAIGNVVGSNLFNLLLVLGATSLVHPIEGALREFSLDIVWMSAITVACVASMRRERSVTRTEGGLYVASYAAFLLVVGLFT